METYGLIGYPLGHSFSRGYFNDKFASEGLDAEYCNFELPTIEQLPLMIASTPTLRGFNVTIPYKQQVMRYLDEITPEAKAIGAVNVVRVVRKGKKTILKGFNSDVVGFVNSLRPLLENQHTRALILGTGGASKAVAYGLQQLGIDYTFVSRTAREGVITYEEVTPALLKDYKVIVNCSPVGMYPHVEECPPLPYEAMDSQTLLYDLIYNPEETLFLRRGREQGALTKNGLEMLLLQAFAGWEMWHE